MSVGVPAQERKGPSYINTNEMQLFFFLFGFYSSTCFGRSLRPSSGVLQTVVAATGVCHWCGVE